MHIINLTPLKQKARDVLPADSLFLAVILAEPDFMEPAEYVAKVGTWLAILSRESKQQNDGTIILWRR
ncbi:MAG: hypothetical protein JRN26_01260 [Nitrososphaerota archaeon]|jgi:hypothetical protein|nr:hypothetical protein [Nitrososphaerota archaeon]MDG6932707.1 hypothetical protein [Nitrososphaerota archaeon]MDG6935507.1 hypothetical protein [Nitrososphaerota archaeon]MDG6943402.1 hypothetical protein [Nitrososphaerota archaeon]